MFFKASTSPPKASQEDLCLSSGILEGCLGVAGGAQGPPKGTLGRLRAPPRTPQGVLHMLSRLAEVPRPPLGLRDPLGNSDSALGRPWAHLRSHVGPASASKGRHGPKNKTGIVQNQDRKLSRRDCVLLLYFLCMSVLFFVPLGCLQGPQALPRATPRDLQRPSRGSFLGRFEKLGSCPEAFCWAQSP